MESSLCRGGSRSAILIYLREHAPGLSGVSLGGDGVVAAVVVVVIESGPEGCRRRIQ